MTSKKPDPTFVVRLVGTGLYPEKVPARMLGDVISAVQVLSNGEVASENAVRLLDIKRGSAKYAVVAENSQLAVMNLSRAGKAASDPEGDSIEYYMMGAFKTLSRIAGSLECKIEIELPSSGDSWSFVSSDYKRIRGTAIVHDDVMVSGELVRVGGATERKCSIRPMGQSKILYCKVENSELSRSLGKHLYREVALTGRGTLFAKTWELLTMTVYSANFPRDKGTFDKYLNELREIAGDGWDNVDPSKELEQLR